MSLGRTVLMPIVSFAIFLFFANSYAFAASISGVYVLQAPGHPIPSRVLADPNIDGVALRYRWDLLEPSDGRFDWSMPDAEIAQAEAHGKKVSLIVLPGIATPNWVYAAGAAKFSFGACGVKGRNMTNAAGATVPVPWDPVYLSKWQAFIRAMGNRYGQNPALVLVKITGINLTSGELYLLRGDPCAEQDITNWRRRGYTPSKIVNSFDAVASNFAQAFPKSDLAVMIVRGPMPPIDEEGNLVPGERADSKALRTIVMSSIRSYGSRFIVQNNALSAFWNWELLPQLRESRGVPIGYQMLWNATGDSQCRMNHGARPCEPLAVLQAAINRGTSAGSSYLEIYVEDADNPALRGVIADAHLRLTKSLAR